MAPKKGYCAYCCGNWRKLTKDHIVPRSKGGNLILLVCSWCNNHKANMLLGEWLNSLPPNFPQHIYVARLLRMTLEEIVLFRVLQEQSFASKMATKKITKRNKHTFHLQNWFCRKS